MTEVCFYCVFYCDPLNIETESKQLRGLRNLVVPVIVLELSVVGVTSDAAIIV